MRKYGELEQFVTAKVIDDELQVGKNNAVQMSQDYEAMMDMLECVRTDKEYDWMSNYFLPEFASIILTDASDWANQYFQTRGFVEVKLEGDNPDDEQKVKAAKICINKTLNNREIYHYPKYIRSRLVNSLVGSVYALCWWETLRNNRVIGYKTVVRPTGADETGNPILFPGVQEESFVEEQEAVIDDSIIYDRFNYEVIDPRSVFVDPKYTYSVQDKDWIIIRSQHTYQSLKDNEVANQYFNLDEVKKLGTSTSEVTETDQQTTVKDLKVAFPSKSIFKYYDVFERYGKFYVTVDERDAKNYPTKVSPGFDKDGNIKEGAVLIEMIITYVVYGGNKVLIRFQPTPYVDSRGFAFKPIVRGWCYIHPSKDTGLSDGKYMKELQVAMNDQFNLSNDRTMLATMPTLKGKKFSLQDNDTIYFEPEHVMELESPDDLVEFKISDDINGSLAQQQMLKSFMEQVTAKFPTAMGELPRQASTTATAVAETSNRSGGRTNYKSLTVEYTFLSELYWMILQMTHAYMQPETAMKIFGRELVQYFDPNMDYTYSPLSSNIEQEYSKAKKLQLIDQMLGRLVNVPNPNTYKIMNYLISKAFDLMGDEFPNYKKFLFDEQAPPPAPAGGGATNNPTAVSPAPMSPVNQSGVMTSPQINMTAQEG